MHVKLNVHQNGVVLALKDHEKVLDEKTWVDENNLLEKFFPALDDLLCANRSTVQSVEKFVLECDMPKRYTTARIARTIIATLNFACQSEV